MRTNVQTRLGAAILTALLAAFLAGGLPAQEVDMKKARDLFRLILKVTIHDNHPSSPGMIKPCGDRMVLSKIAGQLNADHTLIFLGEPDNSFPQLNVASTTDRGCIHSSPRL